MQECPLGSLRSLRTAPKYLDWSHRPRKVLYGRGGYDTGQPGGEEEPSGGKQRGRKIVLSMMCGRLMLRH